MRSFAVAGRPVLHSQSPQIFRSYFEDFGLSCHYARLAADSAREAVDLFQDIGLNGLNVTSPFKKDILPLLDRLDPTAERIGAVNVIIREGDSLKGYNTDHLGVSGALDGRGLAVQGKKCLVIGAGGAGCAAAYALLKKGGEVTLLNRDIEKAAEAAVHLGCGSGGLAETDFYLERADIVVMTIPAGVISLEAYSWHPGQVLLAADYRNQADEPFAAQKGLSFFGGEEWLKHQAIPSARLFLGESPPMERIDWAKAMSSASPAIRENIALIGFMGAGKSRLGRELAARLNYDFVDSDDWIEHHAGKPVPEIIQGEGEAVFRKKEKEAIAELTRRTKLVLACGGGAVLDAANRRCLAEHSLVIWIYASLMTTFSRIEIDRRPLLQHPRPFLHAGELFKQRLEYYTPCADLIIGNERAAEQTVGRIYEEIRISR